MWKIYAGTYVNKENAMGVSKTKSKCMSHSEYKTSNGFIFFDETMFDQSLFLCFLRAVIKGFFL